jgi:hypothetical protein
MFGDEYIDSNKNIVTAKINEYGINLGDLDSYDDFLEVSLKGILSIKIWNNNLKQSTFVSDGPTIYLEEIIANYNQAVALGPLGFKVPLYAMLRRSLENTLSFLYYNDHPVEFYLSKRDDYKRLKLHDYKNFIKNYPFEMKCDDIDVSKINVLVDKLLVLFTSTYKDLSNYVHATNENYFELTYYLEDVVPTNALLEEGTEHISNINKILNVLYILFFFNDYKNFEESAKEIIRLSIPNEKHFKRSLMSIFGEF